MRRDMARQGNLFVPFFKCVKLARSHLDKGKLGSNKKSVQENEQQDSDEVEQNRAWSCEFRVSLCDGRDRKRKVKGADHRFKRSGRDGACQNNPKSAITLPVLLSPP